MKERSVLWEETIEPGSTWSHVLKRGTSLRITDMQGGANVGALFYNFDCLLERYNMADTLKVQHIAYLKKGVVLYSDMGRILCSIVDDSVGWHDPLGGCDTRESSLEPTPARRRSHGVSVDAGDSRKKQRAGTAFQIAEGVQGHTARMG